jgi:predicted acyl esterase
VAAWLLVFVLASLGNLDYGEPIGKEFRARIEAKFFAHYLKDEPGSNASGFDLEDTASFQTGSNTWKYYSHFPPQGIPAHQPVSCRARAAELEQLNRRGRTSYVSDPANPVPYRHRPIQPTYTRTARSGTTGSPKISAFVTGRKDVAVWKLPVLKKI